LLTRQIWLHLGRYERALKVNLIYHKMRLNDT